MSETILQIIPADGWEAVWVEDGEGLYMSRLVAWALAEGVQAWGSTAPRKVIGLCISDETQAVELVGEDDLNFLGYQHVNDRDPEKWKAGAADARRMIAKTERATDER